MKDISEKIMDLQNVGFKDDVELYQNLIKAYEEKNEEYLNKQKDLDAKQMAIINADKKITYYKGKLDELREKGGTGLFGKNRKLYKSYNSLLKSAKDKREIDQIYVDQISAAIKKDSKVLNRRGKDIAKLQKKYLKQWKKNKHQIKLVNYYLENQNTIDLIYEEDMKKVLAEIENGSLDKSRAKAILKQAKKDVKAYYKGRKINGIRNLIKTNYQNETSAIEKEKDNAKDFRDTVSNPEQTVFTNSKIKRDALVEALKGKKITDPEKYVETLGRMVAEEEGKNNQGASDKTCTKEEYMKKGIIVLEKMMEEGAIAQTKSEDVALGIIKQHPEISIDYSDDSQQGDEDKSRDV